MQKVKRIICGTCGNTEEFYATTVRKCEAASLSFHKGHATIDDSGSEEVDIFPVVCAKCGDGIPEEAEKLFLSAKTELFCTQCAHKFTCYTSRDPCRGFKFPDTQEVDLEL